MQNGGQRNRQGGDMSQCVEVRRACAVAHSQPFLTCGFEAGIVTLALRPQGVCPLETEASAVNGKPVIVWNGLVFSAAPVFLLVVPIFVAAGTRARFGLAEGTAEFLAGTMVVGGLAILVHRQSGFADWITGRKRFRGFRVAWIERDKSFPIIDRFCGIVPPSRTHTAAHCAGWRQSGRRGRSPGRFSGGFPWRICFLHKSNKTATAP